MGSTNVNHLSKVILLFCIFGLMTMSGRMTWAQTTRGLSSQSLRNNGSNPSKNNLICTPGLLTNGVTFPRGDIYLQAGDPLEVNCTLDLSKPELANLSAENIVFSLTRLGTPIPDELMKTTVVNNSTAVFQIQNMNASKPLLSCYAQKPEGGMLLICRNEVDIGYLPKEVENFRCIAKNWASLNCTWTQSYNPIRTRYKLTNIISKGYRMACPNQNVFNGTESCEWNGRSEPHYHQNTENLRLEITGTNRLAPYGVNWTYRIDHWKIVVPGVPEKLGAKAVSPHEIEINWFFHIYEYFIAGLVHKVKICTVEDIQECTETVFYSEKLPQLIKTVQVPYAFIQYRVEVRMKSQSADDTAEFWSSPAIALVKTLGKRPDFPPKTTPGSFEVVNKYEARDIYVYWQILPPHFKNGSDFHYRFDVFANNDIQTDVEPNEIHESYAVFYNRSLESHRFEITSVNLEGISPEKSVVIVPSAIDAPKPPVSVSKLDFTNGTYEVSWSPSPHGGHVDSYTVYICNSSRNLQNQCRVLMGWVDVSRSETRLVIGHLNPDGTIYQFAVSANKKDMSSGMVFGSCEQRYDKVPTKITDIRTDGTTSDSINIIWKLDCSYAAAMVMNFRLTYCPVISHYSCKHKEQKVLAAADASEFKLENLLPFTKYIIKISIISRAGESQMSDYLSASTAEAAPNDPPTIRSLDDENTNTTALIMITPPSILNGIIQSYKVTYQSSEKYNSILIYEKDLIARNGIYYYTFINLDSNANYTVTVRACTVSCSNSSEPIYVLTKAGHTNLKSNPTLAYDDGTFLVGWRSPDHLGGPIDHFEVSVKKNGEFYATKEPRLVKYISGDIEYKEKVNLVCESNTNVSVQIRAVTKLQDEILYGDWSPEGVFNCFGGSLLMIWLLAGGGGVLFIILLATTGVCKKWRNMKNIKVKIPEGIEHFQQLNNIPHVQREQNSSGNNETFSFGKDNLTYQLQLTSTPDEIKDLFSSETGSKETEQTDHPSPKCTDGNENLNLQQVADTTFSFEDGKVPFWLWQGTQFTAGEDKQDSDDIIKRNTPTTKILSSSPRETVSPILSDHPHPAGDDRSTLVRLSPSPSNPLLYDSFRGNGSEEDEDEDEDPVPEHYKKVGFLTNGGGIISENNYIPNGRIDPFTVNISIPSCTGIFNHHPPKPAHLLRIDTSADPKSPTYIQNGDIVTDTNFVPDVLTNNSSTNSYVKLNTLNDPPKFGAPYCQVGILLDS